MPMKSSFVSREASSSSSSLLRASWPTAHLGQASLFEVSGEGDSFEASADLRGVSAVPWVAVVTVPLLGGLGGVRSAEALGEELAEFQEAGLQFVGPYGGPGAPQSPRGPRSPRDPCWGVRRSPPRTTWSLGRCYGGGIHRHPDRK